MSSILVTGGTGQVGRELKELLPTATFVGSRECNLMNPKAVQELIRQMSPNVVIHTAARVGGIIDNMNNQTRYYSENVLMDTNLINSCLEYNVPKFIGILSTCAYPDVALSYPMEETALHYGQPAISNFSYGIAKRGLATLIDSIRKEIHSNYCYVIPCNLFGKYDKYNEKSHFVAAILMKILESQKNNSNELTLFGTGQPLRQILYAKDLARIIYLMLESDIFENFNVASEENLSILEYARRILDILELKDWEINFDKTKPDGQFRKDVSIRKLRDFFPKFQFTPFDLAIRETFDELNKIH